MLFVSTNPSTATPTSTVVLAGGSSFDLHNIQYSTMTIKAAGVLLASPASKSITAKSELLAAVRNGESSAQGKEPRYPLLLLIVPSCRGRAPGLLPSRGLFTHSAHPHPSFPGCRRKGAASVVVLGQRWSRGAPPGGREPGSSAPAPGAATWRPPHGPAPPAEGPRGLQAAATRGPPGPGSPEPRRAPRPAPGPGSVPARPRWGSCRGGTSAPACGRRA